MATITREISYRCSDDCVMSGCPGHVGTIEYQSTADAYRFVMNGRELHFERGELEAMLSLLRALNRVDSVQPPAAVDEAVDFEIHAGGEYYASVGGPRERAWNEAMHYISTLHPDDGEPEVFEVTRRKVALAAQPEDRPNTTEKE